MLLGSDLPIFGSEGHPAISLRLRYLTLFYSILVQTRMDSGVLSVTLIMSLWTCRDMQKPITVLTGLDYWLDNLMCNVPELAMCFHLNGIVQVQF